MHSPPTQSDGRPDAECTVAVGRQRSSQAMQPVVEEAQEGPQSLPHQCKDSDRLITLHTKM